MFFIYSFILILLIMLTIIFYGYDKALKKDLSFKDNPLIIFYGLSFFIINLVKNIYKHKSKNNNRHPFDKTTKAIAMLNPGKDVYNATMLSLAKKISLCISGITLFMALGTIYCISTLVSENKNVESLKRPEDGSDKITYSIIADDGETSEQIDVDVSKKMYEYNEIIKIFDSHKEEIISSMLDKNESAEHISYPLSFITSIGEENISLSWQPEDINLIDSSGNILYDNISSDGTNSSVYVSMELNDITACLVIGVTLYPLDKGNITLSTSIQHYLDNDSNPYDDMATLPSEINGKKLSFFLPSSRTDFIFIPLAVISCLILNLLYSNDNKKKLKQRNRQMLQDYPDIVSKLLLLCNAGLNINNALKKIAEDYKKNLNSVRYAYEELYITINSLNNGKSEGNAYREFGKRCGIMPYIRLGALLEQNLHKGTNELKYLLTGEVRNAFENHKAETIILSKQAETKLIFPMVIILTVIMALIMIPSFLTI